MGFDVGNRRDRGHSGLRAARPTHDHDVERAPRRARGLYQSFISPGVPPQAAMLRTSYMATHTKEHLDRGLEAFRATGKKFGVI